MLWLGKMVMEDPVLLVVRLVVGGEEVVVTSIQPMVPPPTWLSPVAEAEAPPAEVEIMERPMLGAEVLALEDLEILPVVAEVEVESKETGNKDRAAAL
jgi:hypothetical protein